MLGTRLKQEMESLKWLVQVDVEDFLSRLEVEKLRQSERDEWNFSCPFSGHSHGDETPSAYMNTGEFEPEKATRWHCHGCKRSGTAISFLAEHAGISRQQARNDLKEVYAPGFIEPEGGKISVEFEKRLQRTRDRDHHDGSDAQQSRITWQQYEDQFGVNWSDAGAARDESDLEPWAAYILGRGFALSDLEEWRIGYDPRSDRITIPICDAEGSLVGVKARYVGERRRDSNGKKIAKYLIIGDRPDRPARYGFMRYEKSQYVVGLDSVYTDWAVLVEGEFNMLALRRAGYPSVATGSAALSDTQARLLRDHFETLIVWMDPDTAGQNTIWGYWKGDEGMKEWRPGIVEKLEPFMTLKIVGFSRSDPAKLWQEGRTKTISYLLRNAVPTSRVLQLRDRGGMMITARS